MSAPGNAPGAPLSFDPEAEHAVLGAAMLDANVLPDVLTLRPSDFAVERCRLIFEAIAALDERRLAPDLVSVTNELGARGTLERVGGAEVVLRCLETVSTAAGAQGYALLVRRWARKRAADAAVQRATQRLRVGHVDEVEDAIADARRMLDEAAIDVGAEIATAKQLAREALEEYDAIAAGKPSSKPPVTTGLDELDEMLTGLYPGEMIVLAARPSVGKSSLATTIASSVALRGGSVLFHALEVPRRVVMRNMLATQGRLDAYRLRAGELNAVEYERLFAVAGCLADSKLVIDDSPKVDTAQIRARAKRMQSRDGLDLVVVDYLQRLRMDKTHGTVAAVTQASDDLKTIARELDVPMLVLSQLNRAVESRDDHRPRISDLRDSGAIEQDADAVLLLYRPSYHDEDADPFEAEIIVGKQRNGPTGTVRARFDRQYLRWEDAARGAAPARPAPSPNGNVTRRPRAFAAKDAPPVRRAGREDDE